MTGPRRRRVTGRRLLVAFVVTAAALGVSALVGPRSDRAVQAAGPPGAAVALIRALTGVGADRQSTLLVEEDQRLLTLVSTIRPGSGPYTVVVGGVDTLVLTAAGLAYGLADLETLGAAQVQPDGAVLLIRNVFVAPGARLVVDAPGTSLRLRSEATGFASLVAWKADLELSGAEGQRLRVASWDPGRGGPDETVGDGRAYIRTAGGEMTFRQTDVSNLGFWAGRTSGVAWTGSSTSVATGSVTDSSFRANHYGAFASQGEGLEISGTTFADNTVDGLSLHRSTEQTTVRSSVAHDNGRHGFSADRGSESVRYTDVTAVRNGRYGMYFCGSPLAEGVSAGGASWRTYGDVVITGGRLQGNGRAGVRVVDGDSVAIRGTRVFDNRDGILIEGTSAPTTVEDTVVSGDHRFGISVQRGAATVSGNEVTGGETAIRVEDATSDVVGNTVAGASDHGISVVGTVRDSSVQGNTVAGQGPSGLDTFRLSGSSSVHVSGNDVEGWERDRDNWDYWAGFVPDHPTLVLWVLVLGLPLALALRARRRPLTPGTAPYPDPVLRERPPVLRVDVGRATPSSGASA
ncbi:MULTISPECIES: right-handed parallel beta-helix repeat-containing protein [unclassified Geodermatophilus]|uniref:right-handed parallel beta-helix repeat-containing protein n=1 Tax=unclassified Geodermatophilus TaxID=2637632 RepID=UPI003EEC0038